ncbi:acetyl-CoA carboxylase biotin carboxylase subunit [Niveibacterium sp.]|uniref:acetyl/propionyl/methylcrotonyl-CoA carboxylase subunit alpha n=1 Tax=Niveibacterium sp. TaxID=2017444 RepID=UPI0035AE322F
MFDKILIANRGEIACRVVRTARRLGVRSVAVYSDADAGARHVRLADEALRIGPAAARESYLSIAAILDAAKRSGAQAIHPGYGFLSENDDFAEACEAAGLVFIGPPASAIRAMGSKSAAKALMEKAGVPLVPGYHGDDQDTNLLAAKAAAIGFPVLIKASAGGGGKGIRIVNQADDFMAALASCKRESLAAFGDDKVLIERYLQRPRHIEIQVFADRNGNAVHLFERDCSVQRRHQKVLEEAPAPGMTAERRAAMGAAACEAARAIGYVGAGTVEFICEPDGRFYFMEMNTRLQVEHPVTEMITGLDLVEWQLRVAAGEALPLAQEQITLRGHAIEARIYAEDPARGFLPAIGTLSHLDTPAEGVHVRIDSGIEEGDAITPHYDPMIAKLIVWDDSRERAIARMLQALGGYRIVGVGNNVEFLSRLVACPAFTSADLDTGLIEREHDYLFPAAADAPLEVFLLAALSRLLRERQEAVFDASPWAARDGWRITGAAHRVLVYRHDDHEFKVTVGYEAGGYRLECGGRSVHASGELGARDELHAVFDGSRLNATVVVAHERRHVFLHGRCWVVAAVDPLARSAQGREAGGGLAAPMPGKVVALLAEAGARVERGAPLLVLEAMKMEHTITAPGAGVVKAYRFAVGDQVSDGAALLDFEEAAA